MNWAQSVLEGDRLALARLLSLVENDTPEGREALNALFPYTGRAHLIGVTGSPGTGKSSLVNQLAAAFRKPENGSKPARVAVVAVDPSSPFTGGAILGDRVRMRDLAGDPGVFVRSMASRGALGGLARQTAAVVQVLDAAGFDLVLIETVGAGQSEVDIARLAHTTLVVEAPGLGDEIQAIKAGILEIADILVVNKADQQGAENTIRALKMMLEMATPGQSTTRYHHGAQMETTPVEAVSIDEPPWQIPVVATVATRGEGTRELAALILTHRDQLKQSGEWQRRERARLKSELENLIQATFVARWEKGLYPGQFDAVLDQLCERAISPFSAVDVLIGVAEDQKRSFLA